MQLIKMANLESGMFFYDPFLMITFYVRFKFSQRGLALRRKNLMPGLKDN